MSGEKIDLDPVYQPAQAALHVLVELIRDGKIIPNGQGSAVDNATAAFDQLNTHFKSLKKT